MEIDAVKTSYARWAPFYDNTFGAVTNTGRRAAARAISKLDGAEVLEVGVGTGLALPYYASDRRVTGVDFSDEMLAKARRRVKEERLTHVRKLLKMDARALEFADATFDAVAAMHIISVVPEPEKVMTEIVRVLKPGGRVFMTNHFAREKGALAQLERWSAPFSDLLGWHSDFEMAIVTDTPGLRVVAQDTLPPLGMMTFLVLEKV